MRRMTLWLAISALLTAVGVTATATPAAANTETCTQPLLLAGYETWACAWWYGGADGYWHVDDVSVWKRTSVTQPHEHPPAFWADVQVTPGTPTYYKYLGKSETTTSPAFQFVDQTYSVTMPVSREIRFSVQTFTRDGQQKCTGHFWIARTSRSYRHSGCVLA